MRRLMLQQVALALSLTWVFAVVLPAEADPPAIYELGTLGGAASRGFAINSGGEVAGMSGGPANSGDQAFLYTGLPGSGGAMLDLGTLGATHSSGIAINSAGQVTGQSDVASGTFHAFLYTGTPGSGGAMADLGTLLLGTFSYGAGVNDSGQVVGHADVLGMAHPVTHAFLYTGTPGSGGHMIDLTPTNLISSQADAINNAGQITGESNGEAFIYSGTPGSGGAMAFIGSPVQSSEGYGINASGQVTGVSGLHAFLFTGTPGIGVMADLGTLGGMASFGESIDTAGQVVGYSDIPGINFPGAPTHAFLYLGTPGIDGQMVDLDAWLDANNPVEGAKWTLYEATGINDSGQIVGYGRYQSGSIDEDRAFLLDASSLTGIPEPATISLLAIGALVVLGRRGARGGARNSRALDKEKQVESS